MERQTRRWRDLLGREDERGATMSAEEEDADPPYAGIERAEGHFLTQAIHHGAEHRTHVCSILGAHDLEVPDVSGWAYVAS
jgi:hypothetical protein